MNRISAQRSSVPERIGKLLGRVGTTNTFSAQLSRPAADLGLSEGSRLEAELHSMLVYAPGQFFLPHQDSEKADEMVGTLVVTLPSAFRGGTLVVEHQGESASYRGSKKHLSFVAFYADCRHEVRPVEDGYRIVLTYNLILANDGAAERPSFSEADSETVDALAETLRKHFETPLPPRWDWQKDQTLRDPPSRLVYLLDHEYTERGLSWRRLKGSDAARTEALCAAAERYGCEKVLALARIQETWYCFEPEVGRYRSHRRWGRGEDGDGYDDEALLDDPDAYDYQELLERGINLTDWSGASGEAPISIAAYVTEDEVSSTTPNSELEAYQSEYEGYMGNYGNTMDRWYRRAAIVLWPRKIEVPEREAEDWSMDFPGDCDCDLCFELGEFLGDPDARQLEWPLAKEKREHVRHQLDVYGLPVRHETRRSGRPYTLVLNKTEELFESGAEERRA